MIFKQAQQVLDGKKGQTRRPVKPGEYAIMLGPDLMEWEQWRFDGEPARLNPEDPLHRKMMKAKIIEVRDANGRLNWKAGKDYAVQTGRGKKAIGRTPLLEAIRRERLQEISDEDCLAEGIQCRFNHLENAFRFYNAIDPAPYHIGLGAFRGLWGHLYRKPYDWASNPECWALVFERVGETGEG